MTDLPDERTIPARRGARAAGDEPAAPVVPSDPADEATVISSRRAGGGVDAASPAPEDDAASATGAPGPRRTGSGGVPADDIARGAADRGAPDPEGIDPEGIDPDDGSTIVVRRESRRRAAEAALAASQPGEYDVDAPTARVSESGRGRGLAVTLASDVPAPLGRVARAPGPGDAVYAAREARPVVVPRTPAPERAPQPPVDTAAEASIARRRDRRLAVIVVVAASLVAVVTAIVLIALLVTG